VTRAVIPAAGLGTRFLPFTKEVPKELVPVVDKPAVQYVVEEAVRAGIDDILIVTGRSKRGVEDHFDRNVELELELRERGKDAELEAVRAVAELAQVHTVRQVEPLGLGHAVGVARRPVGDQTIAGLLPDDLMIDSSFLSGMIATFEQRQATVLALMEVDPEHISAYGSAKVEPVAGDDLVVRVHGVVEKPRPEEAPSKLAVIGRYVFNPSIFDAIERVKPGHGGEIQLTDAVGLLLDTEEVYGRRLTGRRYDTGNKSDWLKATVELAAAHDVLGPDFRAFLRDFVGRLELEP
jgi:UTP--glucose-1-phosphate uridylyltransferase